MATSMPVIDSPEPQGLSQVERVVDTFVAPSKTFIDIRRSAAWWVPFLISVVVSLLFSVTMEKKVGWHQVMENVMHSHPAAEEQMDKLPPDQRAQRESISVMVYRIISFSYPILGLIIAAIGAGILMLTLNLGMGGQATYGQYFATWIYALWLPGAIKALLMILLIFVGGGGENFNLENPIGTNIGFYLSTGSVPAWLHALLNDVDIFAVWCAILLSIGLSIICKMPRGKTYGVVIGWWAIWVLCGVVRAAIAG